MDITLAALMTGGSYLVGATVWLVRLEGRTKDNDRRIVAAEVTATQRHIELREDIRGLRERIDTVLNGGPR